MSALDDQVAGNHYLNFEIQPVEFIEKNRIGFLPGCIIKRICRYKLKGTREEALKDIRKIQHECDLIKEVGKKPFHWLFNHEFEIKSTEFITENNLDAFESLIIHVICNYVRRGDKESLDTIKEVCESIIITKDLEAEDGDRNNT